MEQTKKIILGLSGGVDSAVCAKILKDEGYEVVGVYLDNGCGSPNDAQTVAKNLEIEFHVVDMKDQIEKSVIEPFVQGYLHGQTPIPCILCNPAVKFKLLLETADKHGAAFVATGHYAKIVQENSGEFSLYSSDSANDQSYMLYRVPNEWLSRIKFPLAELKAKTDTRELAHEGKIEIADKPDSMEICFVADGNYQAFIENRAPKPPEGNFVDENGNILGRHKGIHYYTVGQRRGLGISAPTRLFVKEIDVEKNEVVISQNDPHCEKIYINSLCKQAQGFDAAPFECDVKIRHSRRSDRATVVFLPENRAEISFKEPARAPSAGQSAVFYINGRVIGGGFIE